MCGIFGLVQNFPLNGRELLGMSRAIRHRGPDDEGFFLADLNGRAVGYAGPDTPLVSFEPSIPYCPETMLPENLNEYSQGLALGHRRLSILDLTSHGHQPMSYGGRYWIAFNGEIYNFLDIKSELELKGYSFSSRSDTEVILAGYMEWGVDIVERLNGMWAFAIFDTSERTLFLSRDRFGIKPLYLRFTPGRIAFSSEIKAFQALRDWEARANHKRLLDMVVWNVSDHTAETMFDGVVQLPPGHFAKLDLDFVRRDSRADLRQHYRPQRWYSPRLNQDLSQLDRTQIFLELMEDSVQRHSHADVPVGSCLSGGLDSSAMVCLLRRSLGADMHAGELHTFTAQSADRAFDETDHAMAVVQRTNSCAHFTTPNPVGLFDDLEKLVWHQDEPFVSTSIYAQWCVFKTASTNGIKVMLDGQGADEILGGYRGFFGAYLASLFLRGDMLRWGREIGSLRREVGFSFLRSLGYTFAYAQPTLLKFIGRFDGRAYSDRSWIATPSQWTFDTDPLHASGSRCPSVRGMSLSQISATNLPMLLHWEDRNSMAFSVEARVPFLDHRVVEFCLNLPDQDKVGSGISKIILRNAMRGIVPDSIIDRRDKLGFVTAEKMWMNRDMSDRFRKELCKAVDLLPTVLNGNLIRMFDNFLKGRGDFDHRYWRAICAGSWMQTFDVRV
jgi:asparagine synthase (glutamine-hydrolysing)